MADTNWKELTGFRLLVWLADKPDLKEALEKFFEEGQTPGNRYWWTYIHLLRAKYKVPHTNEGGLPAAQIENEYARHLGIEGY